MSGIVGVLHLDGSPIDRRLLDKLTNFLSSCGPDALNVWLDGNVGFGHTLLKTTEESEHEHQPFTLDGNVWIVADCRIDAQRDLLAKLRDHGQEVPPGATDVELILRAYLAWGEDCVQHLLGDFAFGIWDKPRQRLFCARDHMGVKPFYYAHIGSLIIFSNTLDCIRRHPAVSDRLNDLAIADFLLFGHNQDNATTTFADIQRLPPAHCATWTRNHDALSMNRYWTLPIDEPIFYRRADDYCDRFKELLRETVGDRLRTNRIGVFMSGGLDSTTLATATHGLLRERNATFDLNAFLIKDQMEPTDQEERFGALVASQLGISLQLLTMNESEVDRDWEQTHFQTPEPIARPWSRRCWRDWMQSINVHSRVIFHGEGPDNALTWEWRPYVSYLLKRGHYWRFLRGAWATLASNRKPPYWTRILRKARQWRLAGEVPPIVFPSWLNSEFESRLQLRRRWERGPLHCSRAHPIRPVAYASLLIPLWQDLFEKMDPGWTGVPLEVRHPMADVRFLQFMLAVPSLPWCREKYLVRRAMRGILPKPVLRRTKFNVARSQVPGQLGRAGAAPLVSVPVFAEYVDPSGLSSTAPADAGSFEMNIRARALNHWLQNSSLLAENTSIGGIHK